MQISIILLGKLINFFIMILDTLQHNALRKATPGMEKDNIVYLASITPSASTITQMVQVYNKDATYSSLLNVFTTLFCIITMPLAVILFSWLIL